MRKPADKRHYDESRALRLIRDRILSKAPALVESHSPSVIRGVATEDPNCPDNPMYSVPLWYLFGLPVNPERLSEAAIDKLIPRYQDEDVRGTFYDMLCQLAVVVTEGGQAYHKGNPADGFFRRDEGGSDSIARFGTDAIIAIPYDEIVDDTSVAQSTVSHELRHAWDTLSNHWSIGSEYTPHHESAELYYKNPQEIRARVTEIAHQAEDVIHATIANLSDAEYAKDATRVLTEIFGSGLAVFGAWLFGLLTPFRDGGITIDGDPILPRPTMDKQLLMALLYITAGAYSNVATEADRKDQHKVQDWMAEYSDSLYNELVRMYKPRLPSSVFHGDKDKTKQLLDIAHRNLAALKRELPKITW